MKKPKIILLAALTILVIGLGSLYYVFNCGARDLSNEDASFKISSKAICDEYSANQTASNKKYLEKAVQISGTVTSCTTTEIILDTNIICNLKNQGDALVMGEKVTIKGRVVGFDDLMGEVKLDQCFKIK